MATVAIIGTGIAGLGCAHWLHKGYDITLYEQNNYPGGHTNTVTVDEDGSPIPIDTGFMVYNEVTYPNLTRLFRELDVPTKPACMSFSVQHLPSGVEYSGSSLNRLFGRRRNLASLRFWRMLVQINRFNAEAAKALKEHGFSQHTVADYVRERGYGDDFLNLFLVPMSSAVWSTPPERMLDFPAMTLLRFFHNHGFLGLHTQHPWRTVVNGAKSYVEKLTKPFRDKIRLGVKVERVVRDSGKPRVYAGDGSSAAYDKVVFASPADETLPLLADANDTERLLLGEFHYQPNSMTLHSDTRFMPRTPRCWASWNYRVRSGPDGVVMSSTHYWMNSLQGVSEKKNYFVSLNADDEIDPAKILRRIGYKHPVFSLGAIAAQKKLPGLNRRSGNTFFCGSYFRYGFHEDALTSALDCVRAMTGEDPWR